MEDLEHGIQRKNFKGQKIPKHEADTHNLFFFCISLFFHPNSFLQHTLLDNHATQKQEENSVKQMLYKFLFLFDCS